MRSLNKLLQEGAINPELLKILASSASRISKVQKIKDYFETHPEEEREYAAQYETLAKRLRTTRKALDSAPEGVPYRNFSRLFVAASVASGNPLMNPKEYLRELNGKASQAAAPPTSRGGYGKGGHKTSKRTESGHQH